MNELNSAGLHNIHYEVDQDWNWYKKFKDDGDTWVVQLIKHLTLGFGSGSDLRVIRLSSVLGIALWNLLRFFLPLPHFPHKFRDEKTKVQNIWWLF